MQGPKFLGRLPPRSPDIADVPYSPAGRARDKLFPEITFTMQQRAGRGWISAAGRCAPLVDGSERMGPSCDTRVSKYEISLRDLWVARKVRLLSSKNTLKSLKNRRFLQNKLRYFNPLIFFNNSLSFHFRSVSSIELITFKSISSIKLSCRVWKKRILSSICYCTYILLLIFYIYIYITDGVIIKNWLLGRNVNIFEILFIEKENNRKRQKFMHFYRGYRNKYHLVDKRYCYGLFDLNIDVCNIHLSNRWVNWQRDLESCPRDRWVSRTVE